MSMDPDQLRNQLQSFRSDISLNDSQLEIRINPEGEIERSVMNSVLGDIEVSDYRGNWF